jgi:1,4-alpha-glucan branching enzyme
VRVAADFTQWQDKPLAMKHEGNGWWSARVKLAAGEYRFRYLADGQWFTDFASHGVELKKQIWNSILLVPEGPEGAARRMPQGQDQRALAA